MSHDFNIPYSFFCLSYVSTTSNWSVSSALNNLGEQLHLQYCTSTNQNTHTHTSVFLALQIRRWLTSIVPIFSLHRICLLSICHIQKIFCQYIVIPVYCPYQKIYVYICRLKIWGLSWRHGGTFRDPLGWDSPVHCSCISLDCDDLHYIHIYIYQYNYIYAQICISPYNNQSPAMKIGASHVFSESLEGPLDG